MISLDQRTFYSSGELLNLSLWSDQRTFRCPSELVNLCLSTNQWFLHQSSEFFRIYPFHWISGSFVNLGKFKFILVIRLGNLSTVQSIFESAIRLRTLALFACYYLLTAPLLSKLVLALNNLVDRLITFGFVTCLVCDGELGEVPFCHFLLLCYNLWLALMHRKARVYSQNPENLVP